MLLTLEKCYENKDNQTLKLCGQSIDGFNFDVFKKLANLTFIDLSENNIKSLKGQIFCHLHSLITLNLGVNEIQELPNDSFTGLNRLEYLKLYGNKIKKINGSVFFNFKRKLNLGNLKELHLGDNLIEEIDTKAFSGLNKLKTLQLYKNNIATINSQMFSNLGGCLKKLNLADNNIKQLEENVFDQLEKLKVLNLSGNGLESLNSGILKKLGNLKELYLSKNKFTNFEESLFSHLVNLKKLHLFGNSIESLNNNFFRNLKSLERLNLSKNNIKNLEENVFLGLDRLEGLNLQSNNIQSICPGSISNLTSLGVLYLENNDLKSLDEDLFGRFKHLRALTLSGNSLSESLSLKFSTSETESFYLDLSFNHLNSIRLEFSELKAKTVDLNVSSNELRELPQIIFSSSNSTDWNYEKVSINCFFNTITEISDLTLKAFFQTIKPIVKNQSESLTEYITNMIDKFEIFISHDPLSGYSKEYVENFSKSFKFESNNNNFITSVNFSNSLVSDDIRNRAKNFLDWENINKFSLITGKNGVGKSTVLSFIEDLYYKHTKKEFKIYEDNYYNNPSKAEENKGYNFIPVIYKMHDELKIESQLHDCKILKKIEDSNYEKSWDQNGLTAIKIFSVKTVNELILIFEGKENRFNQHFPDEFKYKIEIEKETKEAIFISKKDGVTRVKAENLSPGEKLIVFFHMWEFALTRFPIKHTPILLLDEPDAHLHPKAVHDLVKILKKLSKAGAQVIMTTHNPTTVSFFEKEELFCMKESPNGKVVIEKAQSKANIVRELTDNLLLVNVKYRTVFVEGKPFEIDEENIKYDESQSDALFYRNVIKSLSECGSNFNYQYFFKAINDCNAIFDLMEQFEKHKFSVDYFAIIDNDNNFTVMNNYGSFINQQYGDIATMFDQAKKTKKNSIFNLLRYSLENYVFDPINLFCYLNFIQHIKKQKSRLDIIYNGFDETKLHELHDLVFKKIESKVNKRNDELNMIFSQLKETTKVSDIIKNEFEVVQSIVSMMGELIVDYLTEKIDGLSYRIFVRSEKCSISSLIPILRFSTSQNFLKKDKIFLFSSTKFSLDIIAKIESKDTQSNEIIGEKGKPQSLEWPGSFEGSWEKRIQILADSKIEIEQKNEELKTCQKLIIKLKEKIEPLLSKKEKIKEIFKKKEDLNRIEDKINEIEPRYFKIKDELDGILISEIKQQLLDTTIDCRFAGSKNYTFKYPKVFYLLRGHYLEEVLWNMFYTNEKFESLKLVKEIVRDDGIMNSCGYLVPNELDEIFTRIDKYEISTSNQQTQTNSS